MADEAGPMHAFTLSQQQTTIDSTHLQQHLSKNKMATRAPLTSLQVPANPSNGDLLNAINKGFADINEGFADINKRMKIIESTQNPMSDDRMYHMPVIGGNTHQLTDPAKKQATYTWMDPQKRLRAKVTGHIFLSEARQRDVFFNQHYRAATVTGNARIDWN